MELLKHDIILYLDVKTIAKYFNYFSDEELLYWMNDFEDDEWKKLDIRLIWRCIKEENKLFLYGYLKRLYRIYDDGNRIQQLNKWIRFMIKYEKMMILEMIREYDEMIKNIFKKSMDQWIQNSIYEKKSKKFIQYLINVGKSIENHIIKSDVLIQLIENGYFDLFEEYYPKEKEDRDRMFEDIKKRKNIKDSKNFFFQDFLHQILTFTSRMNDIENIKKKVRIIFAKMELEEGDLNLHESYFTIMELLKIEKEGLFQQLQTGNIHLPETFVTDFLKQHWNRSKFEIPSCNLDLLDFILYKMEKRPQFQYPEDDKLHNDIQDNMFMILKIYKDGPSKEDSLKIFEFFVTLYQSQLFKVFENEEKKSFRFVDSIIDFMICHQMFEGIPILQNLGYQMKMEHYLLVMKKYKEDLVRTSALYDLNTPLHEVVIEYASTFGYFHLVKFYHEKGCPWNSKILYGACKSLNLDLIEYCFKEGCDWDPRTLYLFNPYFSKQALEREDLNGYRQKIQDIFQIIKQYTSPIELKIEENDQNENDIKKNSENCEENGQNELSE